uniref:Uncharacterized protein n=1 Tax=Rousettus aegyptiacus TaxID=9407 RepID=A0A7J8CHU0_ROUAE|nr:hypothetical protein HJG63_009003 [Rousettus aegyptiacus]
MGVLEKYPNASLAPPPVLRPTHEQEWIGQEEREQRVSPLLEICLISRHMEQRWTWSQVQASHITSLMIRLMDLLLANHRFPTRKSLLGKQSRRARSLWHNCNSPSLFQGKIKVQSGRFHYGVF